MLSIGGLLLGIINIGIVIVLMILIGLGVEWLCKAAGYPLGAEIRKFYIILLLLVAIYMLVALLLGLPSVHLIH